jgi:hypothetical protein
MRLPRSFSAAVRVCQASVAHLTRMGNAATPLNTVSSSGSSGPSSPFTLARNPSKSARASSRLLPSTASLIVEPAAVLMAQPRLLNPSSTMRPSSTTSWSSMRSPQSGLNPSATCVARAPGSAWFRGCLECSSTKLW